MMITLKGIQQEPDHPFWKWLTHTTYLGFAVFFMWLNAVNFDESELRILLEIVVAVTGFNIVKSRFVRKNPSSP